MSIPGVEVTGGPVPGSDRILTDDALAFVHHPHRDGPDGGAAQSTHDVRQLGPPRLDVDGHGEERVDERHGIGAGVLG